MPLEATIYVRFSSQEQASGNSVERQLSLCRAMAERNGWLVDDARILIDEGKSAYSGANRSVGGHLHRFEAEALSGAFAAGHVLVVEHFDRISRQGYDEVLDFLKRITSRGVTLATVDCDQVYLAHERVDMLAVMQIILKSEMAREESDKKSKRVLAAWRHKVEKIQAGSRLAVTSQVPSWLSVDPATREIVPIPERVDLVREIFQLCTSGYGTPAIAKKLNARGEPVWQNAGRRSKHGWTVGYLTRLLTNRAVMGEYRPMRRSRSMAHAESKGVTVLDYYPKVVEPALFTRAQAARAKRRGTSGAWQVTHNNLLSGIARCGECGGPARFQQTVRKGRLIKGTSGTRKPITYVAGANISYLSCFNAFGKVWDEARGTQRCHNRARVRYEPIEAALLDSVLAWAIPDDLLTAADLGESTIALAEVERHEFEMRERLSNLVDGFSRTGSRAMESAIAELEIDLQTVEGKIIALRKAEQIELGATSPEEHWRLIQDLKAAVLSEDREIRTEARVSVNQAFRSLLESVQFSSAKEVFVLVRGGFMLEIDGKGKVKSGGILPGALRLGPDGEQDWTPELEPTAEPPSG